jgi:type IV pilus assembly protein PilB
MERWRSHHVLGSRIDNEFLNRSFQNMAVRIGELLLKEKRITPEQLQEALNCQKANGAKVGFNLVKLGFVKDEEITALLSKQCGVPSINLAQFEIDPPSSS